MRDWPIEDIVAEYERRKNSPTVKDLCTDLGITKQALWERVRRYYAKNPDRKPAKQGDAA